MTADVEMKTFVGGGAGNAADINRIGFEHGDIDIVLGKQIGGGQSRRSRSDDSYICFHVPKPPNFPS